MRMLPGVVLYDQGDTPVGVALAQHWIDSATEYFRVTVTDGLLGIVPGLRRVVWNVEALRLQFVDRGDQLRNGRADIRQLDNVGVGTFREFPKLSERIAVLLLGFQVLRKTRENSGSERNVASFDIDSRRICERFDDGQERASGQGGCFVGFRIDYLCGTHS